MGKSKPEKAPDDVQMHPDRRKQITRGRTAKHSGKKGEQPRKPQRGRHGKPSIEELDWSEQKISEHKKRLRDLARGLTHKTTMPMTLRQNQEREMEAQRLELERQLRKKEQNKLIRRYHMVRFFERQKATRALKKAQREASTASADNPRREELKAAVHEAEVNLNYTMYSPLLEKYVGVYRNGTGFKSPTWYLIETAMAQNLLAELRDRMTDESKEQLDRSSGIQKYNDIVARVKGGANQSEDGPAGFDEDSDSDAGGGGGTRLGGLFKK